MVGRSQCWRTEGREVSHGKSTKTDDSHEWSYVRTGS